MNRRDVSRRRFLGAAGVGILPGLCLGHGWGRRRICPPPVVVYPCPPPPGPYPPPPPPPDKCCPVYCTRPNVETLSAAQLQSLKDGVAAMKARPATDPTSWRFQANVHGTLDPVTSPLWNQCEHGTIQFLNWHRGYLYFFERILRAAAGDPGLCLPYWDWSTSPSLPAAFRDSSAGNPLYEPSRFINDGSALPNSIVVTDLDAAMAEVDFAPTSWSGFSGRLEGSPHGAVHVQIGGLMGSVPTAANDPIFWLHHCNIDRIWDRWLNQGGGRANPGDAAFLDQQYSYADADGSTVTVRVRDILSSATLCYRYDDTPNPPVTATAAMVMMMGMHGGQSGVEVARSGEAAEQPRRRPLGLEAETVRLRVAEGGGDALRAAARDAGGRGAPRVALEIRDIEFAEPPAFTYEVFLNLPENADAAAEARHRVGVINFFGKGGERGHAHGAGPGAKRFTETLDASRTVARLREAGEWNEDELRVTLRPITPTPPAGSEAAARERVEESARSAALSYGGVALSVVR
jgi:tyrosinase